MRSRSRFHQVFLRVRIHRDGMLADHRAPNLQICNDEFLAGEGWRSMAAGTKSSPAFTAGALDNRCLVHTRRVDTPLFGAHANCPRCAGY